jgi:hypothetical protein
MNAKPPSWFSQRIPTYWFCFALAFGIVALIPIWPTLGGTRVILASAYVAPVGSPWKAALIGHTLAATILAAVGTIVLHQRSRDHRVAPTFSIRTLLIQMAVCGVAAALLRHVAIDPVVLGCVLIPILVYPVVCFVAVKLRRYDDR